MGFFLFLFLLQISQTEFNLWVLFKKPTQAIIFLEYLIDLIN